MSYREKAVSPGVPHHIRARNDCDTFGHFEEFLHYIELAQKRHAFKDMVIEILERLLFPIVSPRPTHGPVLGERSVGKLDR